jgi:hypothetical protein
MRLSGELSGQSAAFGESPPSGSDDAASRQIGSREWDRTTDHLHVKEVLYH